ncbi:hypothetical protein [Hyphomonas sp.]|uniref:hypothetical protein n=1 Tax=Hyphomonas sp. TaxID=87 RepID=UPI00391892C6
MTGLFKFLLVLMLGAAGLAGAWYVFADRSLGLPALAQLTDPATWQAHLIPLAGLGAGLFLGFLLARIIPGGASRRRARKADLTGQRAADALIAAAPLHIGYGVLRLGAEAAGRLAAARPAAARLLAAGLFDEGFAALRKAARRGGRSAPGLWRDLGIAAFHIRPELSLEALRRAAPEMQGDFQALFFRARAERVIAGDAAASDAALDAAFQRARNRRDQCYALLYRAQMLHAAGRKDAAEAAFAQAAAIARTLADGNPDTLEAKWLLAVCLDPAGWRALMQGDAATARSILAETSALRRELIAQDAERDPVQARLALGHILSGLHRACLQAGDRAAAQDALREVVHLRREVVAARPDDTPARRELARACFGLSELTGDHRMLAEALEHIEIFAATAPGLAGDDAKLVQRIRARTAA